MSEEIKNKPSRKKYKSPKQKLVRLFENSRDKWKQKAKDAKYQIKLLRKKNKYLEQNNAKQKELFENIEIQLQQMKDNEKRMQNEIDQFKKKL